MSEQPIDINAMDVDERLHLMEALWDSLAEDPSRIPLTSAQQEELDARLDEIDGGDDAGIPWDDVLARVQGRGA